MGTFFNSLLTVNFRQKFIYSMSEERQQSSARLDSILISHAEKFELTSMRGIDPLYEYELNRFSDKDI